MRSSAVRPGMLAGLSVVLLVLVSSVASTPRVRGSVAEGESAHATPSDTFPDYDRTLLLEKTSETSANVSIGDVNGDGHLDIVLAKGRHWPLRRFSQRRLDQMLWSKDVHTSQPLE